MRGGALHEARGSVAAPSALMVIFERSLEARGSVAAPSALMVIFERSLSVPTPTCFLRVPTVPTVVEILG